MHGNHLICSNEVCDAEHFWREGQETPSNKCYGCGSTMTHITDEIDRDYRKLLPTTMSATPHVAAFYRRLQDMDGTLPDPVPLWVKAGKPVGGTHKVQGYEGYELVIHSNGPAPKLFIGPFEAKLVFLGVRKATYPVQISCRRI